jgi:hypothetical protein
MLKPAQPTHRAQVRNQRNKFAALIAAAGQARAEAADRLRLLAAEGGVLSGQAASKAGLLAKARGGGPPLEVHGRAASRVGRGGGGPQCGSSFPCFLHAYASMLTCYRPRTSNPSPSPR